jgi:hypothetical protein
MLERIDDKGAKRPKNICGTIRFTLVPVSLAASHYPVDAPVVDDEYHRQGARLIGPEGVPT